MKLRDYQEHCVEAVLEAWKEHPSCVVVLPTGCGKTVVFAEIIRRRLVAFTDSTGDANAHAMILAHREELVYQAKEKIESITGNTAEWRFARCGSTPFKGWTRFQISQPCGCKQVL